MSDRVSFKYTLTEEDVVRSSQAHAAGKRIWLRAAAAVIVPSIIFIGSVANMDAVQLLVDFAVSVAAGLFIWFVGWPIFWIGFWYIFAKYLEFILRKSPHIGVEYEMVASPDGVIWNSPHGNTDLQWSAYTSVREAAEYFLLYCGITLCSTIPKRVFTHPRDLERFRELIRAHVPDFRGGESGSATDP